MLTKQFGSSSLHVSLTPDKMQFGWDIEPVITADNYYNHKFSQQTVNAQICSQLQLVTKGMGPLHLKKQGSSRGRGCFKGVPLTPQHSVNKVGQWAKKNYNNKELK